jgi:hypothetical protein
MKTCSKCKETQSIENFGKDKSKKDGLRPSCKSCKKVTDKVYSSDNKEKIKEKDKNYYDKNKESIKEKSKNWYKDNLPKATESRKNWYINNFKTIKNQKIEYNIKNFEKNKEYMKIYQRERYRTNFKYRIKTILNKRIRDYIKKKQSTLSFLGCSIEFFIEWISYQFDENMSWENQGNYWAFDHVKPCASFDFNIQEEILNCYHWSNLRPCEKIENCSKGSKIIPEIIRAQKEKSEKFLSFIL